MNKAPIDKTIHKRDGCCCRCLGTRESGKGMKVDIIDRCNDDLDRKSTQKLLELAKEEGDVRATHDCQRPT